MSDYVEATYVIARVLLWTATALALIFPFLYHFYTRGGWAQTPIGRHIMMFRTIIALMLLTTALAVFLAPEITLTVAIVLYVGIIIVLITQIRFVIDPDAMDPQDVLTDEPMHATQAHSLILEKEPYVKSRPVVITMSILAALQFLFGGLVTLNLPDGSYNSTVLTVGAIGTLAVAASQVGVQFYVQNLVTPQVDVAAYRDKTGEIVAGPAAPPEDRPVDVV